MHEDRTDCEFCGRDAAITVRHERLDDAAEWRLVYVTPLCTFHQEKAMVMVHSLLSGRLIVRAV